MCFLGLDESFHRHDLLFRQSRLLRWRIRVQKWGPPLRCWAWRGGNLNCFGVLSGTFPFLYLTLPNATIPLTHAPSAALRVPNFCGHGRSISTPRSPCFSLSFSSLSPVHLPISAISLIQIVKFHILSSVYSLFPDYHITLLEYARQICSIMPQDELNDKWAW